MAKQEAQLMLFAKRSSPAKPITPRTGLLEAWGLARASMHSFGKQEARCEYGFVVEAVLERRELSYPQDISQV